MSCVLHFEEFCPVFTDSLGDYMRDHDVLVSSRLELLSTWSQLVHGSGVLAHGPRMLQHAWGENFFWRSQLPDCTAKSLLGFRGCHFCRTEISSGSVAAQRTLKVHTSLSVDSSQCWQRIDHCNSFADSTDRMAESSKIYWNLLWHQSLAENLAVTSRPWC